MENLSRALFMATAMIMFVIAFSVSLYLVNLLNETAKTLVYSVEPSYYDSLKLDEIIGDNEDIERNRSRIVGVDSIIPTLYRYNKESFAVKILKEDGTLLQYFDVQTELDVASAIDAVSPTPKQKALKEVYDNPGKACYMWKAPWNGFREKEKTRVDLYVGGKKGLIDNSVVDYSATGNNLVTYKDRKFREIFTQYAYDGDTISVNEDDDEQIVSLTGNKQIATKIIIIYQLVS